LERLRNQYGIQKIEAVLPSHYHDDHINGIPYLQQQLGVECWCYENMREILENPRGELIGCVLPTPIRVQRTFRDGERFSWEGFDFNVHYTPGHADYHMAMFGDIDGHSVAFSGDNIFPLNAGTPSLIYRNHVHRTSHQQTARVFLEYMPDILCTGHDLRREIGPRVYHSFARKAEIMTQHFDTLLPGEVNFGLEPSWVQIYPYQSLARPGDEIEYQIRVMNFLERETTVEIALALPEGWAADPARVEMMAGPKARSTAAVKVCIPQGYQFPFARVAIAADITLDGRRLGQVTEATIEYQAA
jgi:glyoxylase-like metal-dependent hydrolase (beta-lactamase superfamily II)